MPRGFYDDFPGAGRSWVAPDGPFNEHLVRDVGVLNLALAVVTIAAVMWLTRPLVRATAWAWLTYSVPHLVYHVRHRGALDPSDQVSSLASLALVLVLALAVLVVSARLRPAARSRSEDHDRVPVMRGSFSTPDSPATTSPPAMHTHPRHQVTITIPQVTPCTGEQNRAS